ncbi:hypothetical protein PVL29_009108 [Vitis rotundifolia]|uniref:Agglutinin domain-containing protein n=1 Tax=Vitis rotundifolia TaxID=103349 RepID=A0AA38ZXL1_VITRO|nr:hypothetical protein PVL29_009108 [Vitis rotundifolia]
MLMEASRARTIEGHPYLEFASSDNGDPTVGNEVFTTHDGSVRIKSDYFGRFWRRSPNWIWADSDDSTTNNSDTLFWPVTADKNVVALRNFGNEQFLKETHHRRQDQLSQCRRLHNFQRGTPGGGRACFIKKLL